MLFLSFMLFRMHQLFRLQIISNPSLPSPALLDPIGFFKRQHMKVSMCVCCARMCFICGSCVFLVHAPSRVCLFMLLLWCVCLCMLYLCLFILLLWCVCLCVIVCALSRECLFVLLLWCVCVLVQSQLQFKSLGTQSHTASL